MGFPIRKSTARWIFAPPRGLSQLVTSFFGSWCQGIRRMLFLAWPSLKADLLAPLFLSFTLSVSFQLFHKKLIFCELAFANLCGSSFICHSNFQTISRSPWVFLIMWVSLVKFLDTNNVFQHFLVTLFYLKKPFIFFLTYFFSVIQFSNIVFKHLLMFEK